jgi:GNAT-like C-terminal domain/N-acyltransferase N-terminal domain
MDLKNILFGYYQDGKISELVEKAIPESEKTFPGVGDVWFLQDEFLQKHAELAQIPDNIIVGFLKLKETLVKDDSLVFAMWHFYRVLRECDYERSIVKDLPDFEKISEKLYPFICLTLLLSAYPGMEKLYAEKAYPRQVLLDTFMDIGIWVKQWYRECGIYGVKQEPVIAWEMGLSRGIIFRLGRLQFHTYDFNYDCRVFRHNTTGKLMALSGDGVRYDQQGLIDGIEDSWDESGHWFSSYSEENGKVAGNLISPDGYAHKEKIELDLNEWSVALQKGDQAINVHIPADGPMSVEACMDSYKRALEFFPKYFPDCKFKSFCCFSWLLDPQFEKLLKETSNIIKFQRSGYLLPFPGSSATVGRVFGQEAVKEGIDIVPHDSGMRKSFAAFLRSGGIFHNGMWLLFPQDI